MSFHQDKFHQRNVKGDNKLKRYGVGDVVTQDEDLYAIVYNWKDEEVARPDVFFVEYEDK